MIILFLISLFFIGKEAKAYPQYISYGYASCSVCHFNYFGNGPLTDYGRALAATVVADKMIIRKSDEVLGNQAGFLFSKKLPRWLRPSIDYRGAYFKRDLNQAGIPGKYIHMDANMGLVLQFLKRNKLVVAASVSYLPSSSPSTAKFKNLISREHYISYQVSKSTRLYAGMTDHVYGIRTEDHTVVSRTLTRLRQNDQTHGLVMHYKMPKGEVGAHLFAGNLYEKTAGKRQKGASAMGEFDLGENTRLGASLLYSTSKVSTRTLGAAHLRMGFSKGSSLLAELGYAHIKASDPATPTQQSPYIWLQSMTRIRRGLNFIFNGQFSSAENLSGTKTITLGPGLQWFPQQRIEFRLDLSGTRYFIPANTVVNKDTLTLVGQFHLWL